MRQFIYIALCTTPTYCGAQLIHYSPIAGGNGHWYESVKSPTTLAWTAARDAAHARGGYLATPTSASENLWIFINVAGDSSLWAQNSFGDAVGPYLGGYQDTTSKDYSEPLGGWTWISGEAWSFAAWHPGQPNDAGSRNQNHLQYWVDGSAIPGPTWQDVQNSTADTSFSYIVEFDYVPSNRPVQFRLDMGGNGHWYEAIDVGEGISWTEANVQAVAKGGYLTTLTSEIENQWVFDNIAGDPARWVVDGFGFHTGPFIGGFQDTESPSYSEPAGGWTWVTGEPWSYTNWAPGQPNNALGGQDWLHFWTSDSTMPQPTWQDVPKNNAVNPISYIIEYEINPLCLADANSDGVLSPADFSAWIAAFNTQSPACDQNRDEMCTPADFSAWVANYNAGCE